MAEQHNPYPGPRPLDAADSARPAEDRTRDRALLMGRQDDVDELIALLAGHRQLVVLTADSGIGKTSLLKAGLIPQLREAGYAVCYFDAWRKLTQATGSGNLMQAMLEGDVGSDLTDEWRSIFGRDARPPQVMQGLQTKYGNKLVVVLDQLEELFRLDPDLGRDFIGSLCRLLTARRYSLRFITSLRREFRYELGVIEQSLQPSEWFAKELESVNLAAIPSIVSQPLQSGRWGVSSDCAEQIAAAWKVAAFDTDDDRTIIQQRRASKVGLIHMQALLWTIWERVENGGFRPSDGSTLSWPALVAATKDTSGSLELGSLALDGGSGNAARGRRYREAFQRALEDYVDMRLDGIRARCAASGGPDALRIADETLACIAEIAPRMSSGTYKIIVDADDLAVDSAIGYEVLNLGEDDTAEGSDTQAHRDSMTKRLVRAVRQICISELDEGDAMGWGEVIRKDDPEGDYGRCHERLMATLGDHDLDFAEADLTGPQQPGERIRTAGRLRDARPLRIGIELAVDYCRGLLWLEEAHIVRFTPGLAYSTGQEGAQRLRELSVSAVHDGFGLALRTWGGEASTRPEACANQLVALRGEQLLRRPRAEGPQARRLVDGFVFDNAVWQGCIITADLRDVTFRDCDLRGLLFDDCDFDNVTFENCITWGMLIQRSRVFGGGITVRATRADDFTGIKGLTFQNGCTFGPKTSGLVPANGGFHAQGWVRGLGEARAVDPAQSVSLTFEGLRGYGLFISDTEGASWEIRDCDLEHVSIGYRAASQGVGSVPSGHVEMVTLGSLEGGVAFGADVRPQHLESRGA